MHAPWEAHIVRVVVQHHHAQRALCRKSMLGNAMLDQGPAQVMKIAAAHQRRTELGR